MSSRKRRQVEQMETTPIARPRAEKIEIASIVTKRLSSHDADDVSEAISSLVQLLGQSNTNADENRKTAVRHGALLAIAQAMYRHGEYATVPCSGIEALVNISCCQIDDFGQDIVEGGGLKCAIWSMGRHLGNSSIQANGCILIGNLFTRLRRDIADQGGLKSVVSAMKSLPQDASVQQNGCLALYKLLLADESPTWAKAAADSGCMQLVISAMNKYPNHAKIQKIGCVFLSRLSKAHDDYRKMVLDAEGLVPVVQALRIHKDNAEVKLAARKAFDAISPNCL